MELHGKTVLVAGGGSGIGRGIAVALAREGCRVAVCGRTEAKLRDTLAAMPEASGALMRTCDVADRGQVADLFAWLQRRLGPPDILVYSAGVIVKRRSMAELDPADWDMILAVNTTGLFNVLHAALPAMRARGGGLVVNISSIAGKRAAELAGPAYCAAKFAATALGTEVGLEERAHGIRVTNIYPGEVDTPILNQRPIPVPEERKALMVHPEDIAACVLAIARLPEHVLVPELVITPLYQKYA